MLEAYSRAIWSEIEYISPVIILIRIGMTRYGIGMNFMLRWQIYVAVFTSSPVLLFYSFRWLFGKPNYGLLHVSIKWSLFRYFFFKPSCTQYVIYPVLHTIYCIQSKERDRK